ncbi:hypothetical protein [Clostridium formicaceticum]|uniref:Uncharacterized protein n=1 Tax=Clostridium formicaceticum TaxID=1497 RepID=A0ABN4T673_9CLOT|nr:hypothetical protein [Clostridium formicaceticum]AOY76588.1 hypothetical protein BJL90_12385 [Clostridium formicaceticum]
MQIIGFFHWKELWSYQSLKCNKWAYLIFTTAVNHYIAQINWLYSHAGEGCVENMKVEITW